MEFRLLGPVGVWDAGRQIGVAGRRERTMLAVLLLAAGRLVPTEKLIDAVWGDAPPVTARRQVHNGMSRLRAVLGRRLVSQQPGYLLQTNQNAVDLHRFEQGIAIARGDAAMGRLDKAAAGFAAALRLWRGPALGGVSGLDGEAARLEERRLAVLAERIDVELELGRHADLIGELSGLVADHPVRERFAAQLMTSLYRCGRQAEALQTYQDARRALIDELGIEPGAELRRIERSILTGSIEDSPTTDNQRPCLLPADVADFTGRDAHVAALSAALCDAGTVSVVTGRGGVGKTALAVHVAHRLTNSFPDGQLYVDLHAGRIDPGEALGRFLRALGVDGSAIPRTLDERAELYRDRLAGRRLLVLLDNAGDEAQLVPLLPGSPGSAVLVTSRARLTGLAGVHPVELDVLDTAQAQHLLERIAGAGRVAAEPAAAAELLALCGHLPLAVRIAGARLAARPHWLLAELVTRLTDERRRLDELSHGGLAVRASLELSFHGLDAAAQRLFRRLGLLEAPDFAAWVAAAVLDDGVAAARELADQLVDARLLEVAGRDACGELRFRFHDLVRSYARERVELDEPPNERHAALVRVLGAWLARAERAHRGVYGGDYVVVHGTAPRWLPPDERRYDEQHDAGNSAYEEDPLTWFETERLGLVAAVRQAAELGMDEFAWDIAHSCVSLFTIRWYLDDWRATHDRALAATRRAGNPRGEAALLYSLSAWHDAHGDYEQAGDCLETALRLFETAGDRHGAGLALGYLSTMARRLGRFEFALTSAERGLALTRDAGDPIGEATAVHSLAQTRLALGDRDAAEAGLTEALAILAATGNRHDHAQVLYSLGELYLDRNAVGEATQAFEQVLESVKSLRDRVGEAYARFGLGRCRLLRGQPAEAELTQALDRARDTGMRFIEARILGQLAELYVAEPDRATVLLEQALQLWSRLKAPLWQARALQKLAGLRHIAGDPTGAGRAWSEARSLLATIGEPSLGGPLEHHHQQSDVECQAEDAAREG